MNIDEFLTPGQMYVLALSETGFLTFDEAIEKISLGDCQEYAHLYEPEEDEPEGISDNQLMPIGTGK